MAREVAKPKLPQTSKRSPISDDANDLKALRTAVVDAAGVGAGLWFSYVFVLMYLLIAVGSVTHRDLFLENAVKLPFINVDLPLIGFFVLGPLLFLIVHAYVLLHFVLLGRKIRTFHTQLQVQIPDADLRARLRDQLPSNVFVQMLAGPREVRSGAVGAMLRLIAGISLVLGPLALLVFFQVNFLPYHPHWGIELWQRAAIIIDLALLWILWPAILRGKVRWIGWRDVSRATAVPMALVSLIGRLWQLPWVAPYNKPIRGSRRFLRAAWRRTIFSAVIFSLVPVLLVFTISTYPGEGLDQKLRFVPIIGTLHQVLFTGESNPVTGRPSSWFSDRLVLTDQSFVDPDKLEKQTASHSFRGRDLSDAVLNRADLRKADFTGAQFNRAELIEANLQGAHLGLAKLQGAYLRGIQLQGADLRDAQLQGAELGKAKLQGADLQRTHLEGASLGAAQLLGARLVYAHLEGADVNSADLEGANLLSASLQGINLPYARLRGANLANAELQGAAIPSVDFQGASFRNAKVWRIGRLQSGDFGGLPRVDLVDFQECDPYTEPWSHTDAHSFAEWRDLIVKQIPVGGNRDLAKARLSKLDPNREAGLINREICVSNHIPPKDEGTIKDLATFLVDLACSSYSAPYVARGIIQQMEYGRDWDAAEQFTIAAEMLRKGKSDPTACPGVNGFTNDDWARLDLLSEMQREIERSKKFESISKPQSTAD
jgi:uncharacterized protein YjbI with pentapeptide repeats